MRRLIVSDLLDNARIWLGVLLVTTATTLVSAVVASDIETGLAEGGNLGLALYAISGTIITFSAVAALVVLGSVTALAVSLHQRAYALWQLVGFGSARVQAVVYAQVSVLALAGGVTGCLLAESVLRPLFRFGFATSPEFASVTPRFGWVSAAGVMLFVLLLSLAASVRGARRAARTPLVQSLREADLPPVTMSRRRWVGAALLLALLVTIIGSLPGTRTDQLAAPLMLIGPLLAGLFSATGPLFMARLVRGWTGLVPDSWSSAWYLSRNAAVSHIGRSAAVINPLTVAIALAGGLYMANDLVRGATAQPGSLPGGAVVLLLGGPLLLSLLGATVSVFMSSRTREREVALLVAGGATWATAIRAAVAEALTYVGTAAVLGLVAVTATGVVGAWVSGEGLSVVGSASGAVFAAGGLVVVGVLLMVPATVVPTLLALRRDLPTVLSGE